MDTVFIEGLRVSTTIGVYEHERVIRQDLIIDLEMGFDNRPAGSSDSFADALDYDAVSRRTVEFIESTSYLLIEAVAENLSELLLTDFPILELTLTVRKPGAVEQADTVGVTISRSRP